MNTKNSQYQEHLRDINCISKLDHVDYSDIKTHLCSSYQNEQFHISYIIPLVLRNILIQNPQIHDDKKGAYNNGGRTSDTSFNI